MKILAWDTSSRSLSVALFEGEKKIASVDSEPIPSESLIPVVDKLLKKHALSLRDIGCLAVGLGPGSFTGLRVGIVSAKLMGYLTHIPLVGISSLEAIAFGAGRSNEFVGVTLDARKNQIYAAVYQFIDGKTKTIQKPILTTTNDFIKKNSNCAIFVNDGTARAESIAILAGQRIRAKKFIAPKNLKPLYLHPKDCNVTKKY